MFSGTTTWLSADYHESSTYVVPAEDPAPDGAVVVLKEELRGKHPRLLLSAEELPQLRAFYASEEGRPWREKIEALRPSSTPPEHTDFLKDATDGQRQGFWRLPTVALHYLMTGDATSLADTKAFLETFAALPDWEEGRERNSGMSAGNIMVGAALAYDWIYDELDPEFREAFRKKLLFHARAMYHGGHLKGNEGIYYWQNDPANNHRWHRNAGMVLSLLAVYEGRPEEQWIMQRAVEELSFVVKWLPHDGTCHEGPGYFVFGGNHLVVAVDAADRCLGTDMMKSDYFKEAGIFRLQTLMPGMKDIFRFGDASEGVAGYNNFLLRAAAVNGQADVKDGLLRLLDASPRSYEFGWFSLLWDDPELARGDMTRLPTKSMWEDIGYGVMRDSWGDEAVAASFICGPFGGYDMLRYSDGGKNYVNVAHDDPDANEFTIALGPDLVVETDGYSKHKASQNHNTILINGIGQMTEGQPEGMVWSQPGGDMEKMAYLTGWKDGGKVVAIEGEAAGSYLAYENEETGQTRPALERYRRTFLWVEGDYILVLDDIRSPEAVEISWLIQSPELTVADEKAGRYLLARGEKKMPMQILSDQEMKKRIVASPADQRGEPMGFQQLRGISTTKALKVVSVYDPWGRGAVSIRLKKKGTEEAKVVVTGKGFEDVWTWESADDAETVSSVSVERKKGKDKGYTFKLSDEDNVIVWKE